MEALKYRNRLRRYLRFPLYMLIIFLIGCIVLSFVDTKIAEIMTAFVVIYGILCFIYYRANIKSFKNTIVEYAIHYGTVQKELIKNFRLPYVLLDSTGRVMWMNEEFCQLVDKSKTYNKSITSIFSEITREGIEHAKEDNFDIHVEYNERKYLACLQRLDVSEPLSGAMATEMDESADGLVAIILFDETDIQATKAKINDQAMVMALLYVDNYDEVFDQVENAKRSMLLALLDRKINKYFGEAEAVVRRLEKDKYLIIFQHKYLEMFENDKFSIVEDITTIKMGNDKDITVSLGIGLGSDDYTQKAQYAHMAIDLALARGGCQVVVKNGQNVSYYGTHGKEVERTTRVKARVKAQALRELMESRDRIIVMGHNLSDADCLGASVGVFCAGREIGKPVNIVIDTITGAMRPVVESFTSRDEYPDDMFITSEQALNICNDNTLIMVVDTNRPSYVECPGLLYKNKNIVVIDHHRQVEEIIENPILSYIEPYASSASEMIAEVLQYFADKININPTEADCIYAGILIDTNNFMTKTGVRTFEAAAFLRRNGAEVTRVRKMLRENMETYKARAEIVRNATTYHDAFAIAECEPDGNLESPTVVGAQAANELLNIVGIKASFVLTKFMDKIFISSRSIDEIDVQSIMTRLGGGGHVNIAGAQIQNRTIEEVRADLEETIDKMLEEGEIKL
ncbi:MAG: DHH family phosphoesterase [Pseudobutyrivibrio sp.]|uniref:Cyclic-di-AMP phosphodiesterase n=5 Tax=Pseudobutyrivibrio TaxID=46205 RepID=A0A2G3ECU9_9FIRM|nr:MULTISPECIES: DHH family phosphoesterase [Pseudobutyrivibrio]MBE5904928.1 DHH family phosphoesterase [Pseudobutyrivibrio sp.]MBR5953247.1 DHH family phosphoesterase [Pseudobutyrivibrio sp.]NEX01976.1 DHH family phosphoesterase [Pseudobutyrivibrio xylanivorans]PHU41040.1 DHH family phosphoesterase [Pseudobutyrivibrio ruminis]SCY10042.1 c-di-AMP phosphodiesterase, consists of a GGDEF-like and DHH domains [Pseudobutyrivibrio sp. AR14]